MSGQIIICAAFEWAFLFLMKRIIKGEQNKKPGVMGPGFQTTKYKPYRKAVNSIGIVSPVYDSLYGES